MEPIRFLPKHEYSKYPPMVQDAVSMIEANYAYLYGVDELADRLEVSKHHLIRVFSACTGISPGKYLINVRMFHAKIMLQSFEDTPLEIIAGACGYSCANYFSKAFKKNTGQTPTEYIKSVQINTQLPMDEYIKKFYL